jgi:ribosomal protein S14
MKYLMIKDKIKRKNFFFSEKNFKIEKLIKKNNNLLIFQKWLLLVNNKFKLKTYKVQIKNRCILTGRSYSVNRTYNLSRIKFRELGREGIITGLKKSSW